jgi:hypothetical protein
MRSGRVNQSSILTKRASAGIVAMTPLVDAWERHMANSHEGLGLTFARQIVDAQEDEWPARVDEFRSSQQLSTAVRHLNRHVRDPQHRVLAIAALSRIGIWHV